MWYGATSDGRSLGTCWKCRREHLLARGPELALRRPREPVDPLLEEPLLVAPVDGGKRPGLLEPAPEHTDRALDCVLHRQGKRVLRAPVRLEDTEHPGELVPAVCSTGLGVAEPVCPDDEGRS